MFCSLVVYLLSFVSAVHLRPHLFVWYRLSVFVSRVWLPFVLAMGSLCLALIVPLILLLSQVTLCDGRLIFPHLGVREWKTHDVALKSRLDPLHSALSADAISPSEAASEFSATVADFLASVGVFKGGEGRGGGERDDTDTSDDAFLAAKREKKRLQRLVFGRNNRVDQGLRAQFYQAVKTLSYIRRVRERRERERDTRGQEKSYLKNFWAFSRRAVSGGYKNGVKDW